MKEEYAWLSIDDCLQHFGKLRSEAVIAFHEYVNAGMNRDPDIDFKNGFSDGILGDDDFIEKERERMDHSMGYPLTIDFPSILSFITEHYNIHEEMLRLPNMDRKISHIRSVMALIMRDAQGVSLQELADFCNREASGMSKAAARLESRMQESSALRSEVDGLKAEFILAMANS